VPWALALLAPDGFVSAQTRNAMQSEVFTPDVSYDCRDYNTAFNEAWIAPVSVKRKSAPDLSVSSQVRRSR
jgi:hypothetical protein